MNEQNSASEKLNERFLESMKELLGEEYALYLESFSKESFTGIRVNMSKISPEEFERISPFSLRKIPWTENGYYVSRDAGVTKHPYYYAGLYYVQEPSAMVPASRLPVNENDRILDLCAAPGGKTTHLGDRLKGSGMLVSNDISSTRAKALLKNVELFGIGNCFVCSESPEKLEKLYGPYFDKILIDAPCSGEGMFRKDPAILKSYGEHGPEYYREIQNSILDQAYRMLTGGGMILYSTCTFSLIENEDVIRDFLNSHPDMHMKEAEGHEGFCSGICRDDEDRALHLERCIRVFPHMVDGEGHFAALMEKDTCEEEAPVRTAGGRAGTLKGTPSKADAESFTEFCRNNLNISFRGMQLKTVQESLYALPKDALCPDKVRFLRTGLYLGDCKKNRFEPSQALAMYLHLEDARQTFDLSPEDERVIRYLKGETLSLTASEAEELSGGWVLICTGGFPLGWGKIQGSSIKNKYYSGWRML